MFEFHFVLHIDDALLILIASSCNGKMLCMW